jgi:hypothetical protein
MTIPIRGILVSKQRVVLAVMLLVTQPTYPALSYFCISRHTQYGFSTSRIGTHTAVYRRSTVCITACLRYSYVPGEIVLGMRNIPMSMFSGVANVDQSTLNLYRMHTTR